MGRTSASQRASGGNDSRGESRPSNDGTYRRPSGANADGAPTVRNIIPWRDMEKKLAERLAAKAAAGELSGELEKDRLSVESKPSSSSPPWKNDQEAAPDSGVRTSAASTGPTRDLTYSVYTLEDLEARAQARSPRMSMTFVPTMAPTPARWADAGKSGLTLLRAWWACMRTPKPRPRVMDVCRVPLTAFLTDLKVALRALPWRRVALGVGVAVGAVVLLLGLVLTAAELTDDLKPRRGRASLDTAESAFVVPEAAPSVAVTAAVKTSAPATTATTAPVVAAPAPPEPASIEIDDEAPRAKPAVKPAAPKSKPGGTKKKGVELFIP
jgi:hypothetical protein